MGRLGAAPAATGCAHRNAARNTSGKIFFRLKMGEMHILA
jgi:hypothetical protein